MKDKGTQTPTRQRNLNIPPSKKKKRIVSRKMENEPANKHKNKHKSEYKQKIFFMAFTKINK